MTHRIIEVFRLGSDGRGCFKDKIEVTCENFVAETDKTIIISRPDLDNWGGTQDSEQVYFKTIDAFIRFENERFVKHIADLNQIHETTIKMAEKYKREGLTIPKNPIVF